MQKRKFTIMTQLYEKNNKEIIDYFESSRKYYAKAVRQTFQLLKHCEKVNKSSHNTYLQNKYGITRRTANSIIIDAETKFNALLELKKYELKQLERKVEWFQSTVIPQLQDKKNLNCELLRANKPINLVRHRNLRRKLLSKKDRLNRMTQKVNNLKYQIESKNLKLCFGTKKLLTSNYELFVERRDSQMSFVGTKAETQCNSQFQLTYDSKINQFYIKMRKDFGGFKTSKGNERYAIGKVYFNHHKSELLQILRNGNSPLSYKIIKRKGRYYLYCTFEIQREDSEFLTRNSYGTIGLDFNKGFVTLSETNCYGHLVDTKLLTYRFRKGNKTNTDLERIASYVTKLSLELGKDLVIEGLNFKVKKSKTEKGRGKKYNEMLHSLAYQSFVSKIESSGYRNKVNVIKVNPAWTSWIAKKKFCNIMKLNTHIGASYVIARRGMGVKDVV